MQFFDGWRGQPYSLSSSDTIEISITQGTAGSIAAAVDMGADQAHQVRASFTVRKSGRYDISVKINSVAIRGCPFVRSFIAGPPNAAKSHLVRPTSMAVCNAGTTHQLELDPCDEYGNRCSDVRGGAFSVEALDVECGYAMVDACEFWSWNEELQLLHLVLQFSERGIYLIRIKLGEDVISKGEFNMIALTGDDARLVDKDVQSLPSYSARLLSINGEECAKAKKVYCALSPKQIAIKEYFLKIIATKLVTFRLCPSTKVISLHPTYSYYKKMAMRTTLLIIEKHIE